MRQEIDQDLSSFLISPENQYKTNSNMCKAQTFRCVALFENAIQTHLKHQHEMCIMMYHDAWADAIWSIMLLKNTASKSLVQKNILIGFFPQVPLFAQVTKYKTAHQTPSLLQNC